jgi:hypothetical protein
MAFEQRHQHGEFVRVGCGGRAAEGRGRLHGGSQRGSSCTRPRGTGRRISDGGLGSGGCCGGSRSRG